MDRQLKHSPECQLDFVNSYKDPSSLVAFQAHVCA